MLGTHLNDKGKELLTILANLDSTKKVFYKNINSIPIIIKYNFNIEDIEVDVIYNTVKASFIFTIKYKDCKIKRISTIDIDEYFVVELLTYIEERINDSLFLEE